MNLFIPTSTLLFTVLENFPKWRALEDTDYYFLVFQKGLLLGESGRGFAEKKIKRAGVRGNAHMNHCSKNKINKWKFLPITKSQKKLYWQSRSVHRIKIVVSSKFTAVSILIYSPYKADSQIDSKKHTR